MFVSWSHFSLFSTRYVIYLAFWCMFFHEVFKCGFWDGVFMCGSSKSSHYDDEGVIFSPIILEYGYLWCGTC